MDKLERYRQILRRIVEECASYRMSHGQIETEAIIDRETDHYEVRQVGWDDYRRIHGSVIHLDIKNGKTWLQYDGTEYCVADRLIEAGVPKEDIVLGFQPEEVRPHTGFAVG